MDWERVPLHSGFGIGWNAARRWERIDLGSSMGVKILWVLRPGGRRLTPVSSSGTEGFCGAESGLGSTGTGG